MYAVHRSYDTALKNIELAFLIPTLKTLLTAHARRPRRGRRRRLPAEVRADVDLYLTVARRLLGDTAAAPVAGAATHANRRCWSRRDGSHRAACSAFRCSGRSRYVDFSQFKPRGHYAGDTAPRGLLPRDDLARPHRLPLPSVRHLRAARHAAPLLPPPVPRRPAAGRADGRQRPHHDLAADRRRAARRSWASPTT